MSCNICLLNKSKLLTCPFCKFESCIKCLSIFFISLLKDSCVYAQCINSNCSKELPISFLVDFPKSFHKEYNKLLGNLVFFTYKPYFYQLSSLIEMKREILNKEKECEKYEKKKKLIENELKEKILSLDMNNHDKLVLSYLTNNSAKEKRSIANEIKFIRIINSIELINNTKLYDKFKSLYNENLIDRYQLLKKCLSNRMSKDVIYSLNELFIKCGYYESRKKFNKNIITYKTNKFLFKVSEFKFSDKLKKSTPCRKKECNGVMYENDICISCLNYNCPKCLQISDDKLNHICDDNDILFYESIKNDYQNCPNCKEAIVKSEACNIMFCTNCNTHFNYITGKKITSGSLHNPHYIEWLEKNNMNYPDNENIDLVLNNEELDYFSKRIKDHEYKDLNPDSFINALDKISSLNNVDFFHDFGVNFFDKIFNELENSIINYIIKYMVHEITFEELINNLSLLKKKEIFNKYVENNFNNTKDDIKNNIMNLIFEKIEINDCINNVKEITNNFNNKMKRLLYIYSNKVPKIKFDPTTVRGLHITHKNVTKVK